MFAILKCKDCGRMVEYKADAKGIGRIKPLDEKQLLHKTMTEGIASKVWQLTDDDCTLTSKEFTKKLGLCACDIELLVWDTGWENFNLNKFLDSGTFEDVTSDLGKILFNKENADE